MEGTDSGGFEGGESGQIEGKCWRWEDTERNYKALFMKGSLKVL